MAHARRQSGKGSHQHQIYGSVKKGLDILLKSFRDDETATEYTFSASLSTEERAYVHASAQALGMKSKSQGKGNERKLTVTKKEVIRKNKVSKLNVHPFTVERTVQLLNEFPLTPDELQDVQPLESKASSKVPGQDSMQHADCIKYHVPIIPQSVKASGLLTTRKNLPTWGHREEILNMINNNKVVMITGDTGSGKTTQVPQYLLELFSERNEPVRIVCTQPRRIAAISVAERVANERGEHLGGTVGYQIRLENRVSAKTALMFCTTGILLRTLMYQEGNLERVTHLIIDEVHERDRFVDFLLGVLRSRLPHLPNLRLILMSAALDISVFSNYFDSCPVLHVQGKCFPVAEYFLEDVLELTDHLGHSSPLEIGVWEDLDEKNATHGKTGATQNGRQARSVKQGKIESVPPSPHERLAFDTWIQEVFILDTVESLEMLSNAILRNCMPANYRHSQTQLTPLMVVAARGRLDLVNEFLRLGADPAQTAGQWTAAKLARSMNHHSVADTLEKHQSEKSESLLRIYKDRYDEEVVNVDLVMDLLHMIDQQSSEGAVLIFLPGYEEIMNIRDRILYNDSRFASSRKFEVYTLHSSMQSGDQRRVFSQPPQGKRKIVLSTNLAETSITIDDIVFVIDTGKVKVKSYDALTGVSALKAEWVPQASAIQRKGRAGRCREGVCYHLFSRQRYESFEKFQIPEIFRVPLEELCLQSKNLAPVGLSIAEFIGQVPEAPNPHVIQRAVKMLQWMDALDPWENVTDLGRLLLELPVEPRLGKMLLTAVVLHCLDPVLTIVCCLSHRDPFLLPNEPNEKKIAAARKLELAAGTLSDHMAMLRAFNLWSAARANGREREFCHRHFLSTSTMDVILQLRTQILDQLRKSGFVRSFQELNTNATSWVAIKACILSGLYPQVARACRSGKLTTRREPSVRLHMTSALLGENGNSSQKKAIANLPSEWMVYEEISRYGGLSASLRCVTLVNTVALTIFGGHCRLSHDSIVDPVLSSDSGDSDDDDDDDAWTDVTTDDDDDDDDQLLDEDLMKELGEGLDDLALAEKFCRSPLPDERDRRVTPSKRKTNSKSLNGLAEFHLDDWIKLKIETKASRLLFALRQKWQALFARRMRDPVNLGIKGDKQVVDAVLSILAKEEEASGLPPCPEFLGVNNAGRMAKFENFRGNRRPNSGPITRAQMLPNSKQIFNFRANSREFEQLPKDSRDAVRAKEDQNDRRFDMPRSNSSAPYPNKYYGVPRGSRSKNLGNLRFRTGIAEVDFMVPATRVDEPGQSSRTDANRSSSIHETIPFHQTNKNRLNEASSKNKSAVIPNWRSRNETTRGKNSGSQMFYSGSVPPTSLANQSSGRPPSDFQSTKCVENLNVEESKKKIQKERPQFVHGATRLPKESETEVPLQDTNTNGQPTRKKKGRWPKRKGTNGVQQQPTP